MLFLENFQMNNFKLILLFVICLITTTITMNVKQKINFEKLDPKNLDLIDINQDSSIFEDLQKLDSNRSIFEDLQVLDSNRSNFEDLQMFNLNQSNFEDFQMLDSNRSNFKVLQMLKQANVKTFRAKDLNQSNLEDLQPLDLYQTNQKDTLTLNQNESSLNAKGYPDNECWHVVNALRQKIADLKAKMNIKPEKEYEANTCFILKTVLQAEFRQLQNKWIKMKKDEADCLEKLKIIERKINRLLSELNYPPLKRTKVANEKCPVQLRRLKKEYRHLNLIKLYQKDNEKDLFKSKTGMILGIVSGVLVVLIFLGAYTYIKYVKIVKTNKYSDKSNSLKKAHKFDNKLFMKSSTNKVALVGDKGGKSVKSKTASLKSLKRSKKKF